MADPRDQTDLRSEAITAGFDKPGTEPKTATFQSEAVEKPGETIGPYKLLDQLGAGGMGTVYVADQERPVRRRVAVKVIKPGLDTDQVIARFEAERQALALMDHPNIARVLDAGTTTSGRPYFVMELVQGSPITTYCDTRRASLRERLELFLPVCRAVQHAHQKGIIHRDLKPSNILITVRDDQPVPKIIDFGIAKATTQRLTEKTLYTQYGQLVGTPEYMSPEQAGMGGLDVDTRSDVYSLGAVLYELLCGDTPFGRHRLTQLDFVAMLNVIYEEDPPPPSRRLTDFGEKLPDVARRRDSEPHKLAHSLKGELDWITSKALEKERTRRYESASALAADIERYLNNEPVEASSPSRVYRLRKFVRRNRAPLSAATAIALVLIAATIISGWQAYRATQAEQDMGVEKQAALAAKGRAEELLVKVQKSEKLAEARRLEAENAKKLAEERGTQIAGALAQAKSAAEKEREVRAQIEVRLREADAMRLAMQSRDTRERYPQRSLLLAAEAVQATRRKNEPIIPAANQALRDSLESIGGRPMAGHNSYVAFMEVTADGRWLITSDGSTVLRWDLAEDDPAQTSVRVGPPGFEHAARALSRDGRWLATIRRVPNSDRLFVWDLWQENFEEPARQVVVPSRQNYVNQVAFSPDAKMVAASAWNTAWVWDLGRQAADEQPITLIADNAQFNSIAISANGRWAISQGGSTNTRLWPLEMDESKPTPQALFADEGAYVQSVQQSADGRWLAAMAQSTGGNGLRVWDLNAEAPLRSVREVPRADGRSFAGISLFRFTPDGRFLATGRQRDIALWDLSAEKWDTPKIVLPTVEAAPQTTTLTQREVDGVSYSTAVSAQPIANLAIDHSGRFLVAADSSGTIMRWDLRASDPKTSRAVVGRDPGAFGLDLTISPSGRWLITSRYEESPRVWDLAEPRANAEGMRLHAHDTGRAEVAIGGGAGAALPPGIDISFLGIARRNEPLVRRGERWIITRGNDSKPRLWDLRAPNPGRAGLLAGAKSIEGDAVAVRPDGKWVIWNRSNVQIVDLNTPDQTPKSLEIRSRERSGTWSSDDQPLSEDGRWLAMNHGERISIWDLADEKGFGSPPPDLLVRLGLRTAKADETSAAHKVVNAPANQRFESFAISPHGKWLLSQAGQGWQVWSLKDTEGSLAVDLSQARGEPRFSPDDRWICGFRVTNSKANVSVWDLASNPPKLFELDHPQGGYFGSERDGIAFSGDGRWLAVAGQGIRFWRLPDEGPVGEPQTIAIGNDTVRLVSLSHDGRFVAAASNQTLYLFDREEQDQARQLNALRGHEQYIDKLAFSPDGAWLASSSQDREVRLWNLQSENVQDTMIALRAGRDRHRQQYQALLFDPDGRWLAAKTYDSVHFWQLEVGGLVEAARELAARDLNTEELERYRLNTHDHLRDRLLRQAAELSKQLEKSPQDATLLKRRADLYACAGQFERAIEELRVYTRINPDDHYAQYQLLALLAETGAAEAYRRSGQEMAERFRDPPNENLEILERVAKGNLFWAESGADFEQLALLADRALEKSVEANHWVVPYAQLAKGLAEYRRGNYAAAVDWADKGLKMSATNYPIVVPGNQIKAMALASLGRQQEAQAALELAKKVHLAAQKPVEGWIGGYNDWHMGEIMLREAEAVLLAKSPPDSAAAIGAKGVESN
jgi:serine/threonine protein kinase/WD40 repeat protein